MKKTKINMFSDLSKVFAHLVQGQKNPCFRPDLHTKRPRFVGKDKNRNHNGSKGMEITEDERKVFMRFHNLHNNCKSLQISNIVERPRSTVQSVID